MIIEILAVALVILIKIVTDVFLLANSIAKAVVLKTKKHRYLTILWLFNWMADVLFMVILIGAVMLLL